jgi:hypothetical protein
MLFTSHVVLGGECWRWNETSCTDPICCSAVLQSSCSSRYFLVAFIRRILCLRIHHTAMATRSVFGGVEGCVPHLPTVALKRMGICRYNVVAVLPT